LKCAIDQAGLTPGVERVMRAVAAAHRATGAPITVHTFVGNESGLIAQRVFAEEGVDLSRVVIGHCGDSTDLTYLRRLADAGSFLGMDRFGIDGLLPTADRIATVVALCKEGYADQLVLSHDASCFIDWFNPEQIRGDWPDWHFEHISMNVLPALRKAGVTEEQISTMMETNPGRYFENVAPY
jgi:phosphotriesterase-related protein